MNEIRWSHHNLSRLLRSTGEPPSRVREIRAILLKLGMDGNGYLTTNGAFDHGSMYARGGKPALILGWPYELSDDQRRLLASLEAYPALRVAIDDQPSEYGHGTHRVAIEVREPVAPIGSGMASMRSASSGSGG